MPNLSLGLRSCLPFLLVLPAACTDDGEFQAEEGAGSVTEDISVAGVTFAETKDYVDWSNAVGSYRIYKKCLGPIGVLPNFIGRDASVGPGYVARITNRNGQVISDDTQVKAHLGLNSGATGLGQFGFHLARGEAPMVFGDFKNQNAKQISSRFCNSNRRPSDYAGYNGWGVRGFSAPGSGDYVAPNVDSKGVGHFTIESTLGDEFSDLVRVKYTYEFSPKSAKLWVRVTNLCANGRCDRAVAGGSAFVKEPKITLGVNPASPDAAGYRLMTVFNEQGNVATSATHDNRWTNSCSASDGFPDKDNRCEYGGVNPVMKTGQCDDGERARVRFWNGKDRGSDPSCLVVAARAAMSEGQASRPWEGSGQGIDRRET